MKSLNKFISREIRTSLLLISFSCLPVVLQAQVNLPANDLGLTSINDGVAGPAILYEAFLGSQNSTRLNDANGDKIPGDNSLHNFLFINHLAIVSKKPMLDGFPVAEILIPLVNVGIEVPPVLDENKFGLGDAIIGAGIQWPNKKLFGKTYFHRFLLNVIVPTGTYDKEKVVNVGSNVWSIMPYYAFTIYWDASNKWETSMRFRYMWNSKNNDPFVGLGVDETQPGQAFYMNYGVSYNVGKEFRVGAAGYFLQQLTDHQIAGNSIPNSKEMAFAVGPAFFKQYKTYMFRLTAAFDVAAKNRWSQTPFVNFTFTKVWPK
ncbi:MAG: transporter [Weeksellaceae bacterium]|nr:transporter [Weeksellaceae bacterium]